VVEEFVANGVRRADKELDLGPAIASIIRDEALAKKGKLRNFPRNLKVTQAAIQTLDVQKPPLFHEMEKFQLPTLWMGTSSSDTRFHHDCCDNFVYMLSGTKRFTLAPASDWRTLTPTCVGQRKALCWASVAHPNLPAGEPMSPRVKKTMNKVNKIVVDVGPGEVLFMPAGWFHHIQNLGPTVMVNWWTTGTNQVGLATAVKGGGGMGGMRRQQPESSSSGY
jgi:mannose-6-phosphate isomerase-like protein (cupin superfamily)